MANILPLTYAGGLALYLLMYGIIRLMRRRSPADSTTSILENWAFTRFELRRRK